MLTNPQHTVTSAFNIITDIWILGLPIKALRSIERPTREKVALFFIFGAGTFAAIASIIRLHTIYTYTEAEDPFKNSLRVNVWSMIEINVAICCASVSALKPVFSRGQRQRSRAARSSASATTASEDHQHQHQQPRRSTASRRSLWHLRSGSKATSSSSNTNSSSSHDEEKALGPIDEPTEPRPVRPPPVPLVLDGRDGVPSRIPTVLRSRYENNLVSDTTDSSMFVFTPLSPRPKDGEGVGVENGPSSSGDMLPIQK